MIRVRTERDITMKIEMAKGQFLIVEFSERVEITLFAKENVSLKLKRNFYTFDCAKFRPIGNFKDFSKGLYLGFY